MQHEAVDERNPPVWRQRNLLRLIVASLAIQLLYWIVFVPSFVSYRAENRPEFIELTSTRQAILASPDGAGLGAAQFEDYDQTLRILPRGYYATRISFELEEVPPTGLAMLDLASGDHIRFYVNGELLSGTGDATLPRPTYHGLQKRIIPVSAGSLRIGSNQIDVVATFDVARQASVDPPLLAEFEAAEAAYAWTDFLYNDWRNLTIAMALVTALMVGAAAIRASDKAIPVWLFLLTISWALHSLYYRWVNFPLAGEERVLFYAAVFLFMSASWPAFIDAWTKQPMRYFAHVMMAIFAISASIAVFWLLIDRSDEAFTQVEGVLDQVGLVFVIITIGRLVWHFVKNPDEERILEGSALILLASLIGFFLYNTWLYDRYVGHLQAAQPLLLVALALGFFAGKFHLFRSSSEINSLLQSKLDMREQELAKAHAREQSLLREQTLDEERQRIMRDMHDGLGSQLMSLMMMARREAGQHRDYADGLQSAIDEMRLMIESMDSVGESLRAALTVFRKRVIPRANEAGFDIEWIEDPQIVYPALGPRDVLQIFRILQEAVTNAIRHSHGNRIEIEILSVSPTNEFVGIKVEDNGKGIPDRPNAKIGSGGQGMKNMQARARGIGARFNVSNGSQGVVVKLTLAGKE